MFESIPVLDNCSFYGHVTLDERIAEESMPITVIVSILIVVIIIAVVLVTVIGKMCTRSRDEKIYLAEDDNTYKRLIVENTSKSAKPYVDEIFSMIDEINRRISATTISYEQPQYEVIKEILALINTAEEKIKWCWDNPQFHKDFSFYVGLHYASHLLGLSLKSEQFIIREVFVEYKTKREQESECIANLKHQQKTASGDVKNQISRDIAAHCLAHKRLCTFTNAMGDLNSLYRERATKQFMETAERRDYIATHFGRRGTDWKERIHMRGILRDYR